MSIVIIRKEKIIYKRSISIDTYRRYKYYMNNKFMSFDKDFSDMFDTSFLSYGWDNDIIKICSMKNTNLLIYNHYKVYLVNKSPNNVDRVVVDGFKKIVNKICDLVIKHSDPSEDSNNYL